jgi:predicted enzyme related to lactoylglutathione lyase
MSKHPVVHIEFPASDPAAASKFYADLFGWKIQAVPEFNYYMFEAEGGPGGGFTTLGGQMGYKPGELLVYVETDNIEASLAQVEALGGKTLTPRMEIPGQGWFAFFADPTGNRVALYTPPQHTGS